MCIRDRCIIFGYALWTCCYTRVGCFSTECLIATDTVCTQWTSQPDTHYFYGHLHPASTLVLCQAACINNPQCAGLDWDPTNTHGHLCWQHGSWSGARDNMTGVTHYNLSRTCPASGNKGSEVSAITKYITVNIFWSVGLQDNVDFIIIFLLKLYSRPMLLESTTQHIYT